MKHVELKKDFYTILGEVFLWFSAIIFLVVCFAAVAAWVGFLVLGFIRLIGD